MRKLIGKIINLFSGEPSGELSTRPEEPKYKEIREISQERIVDTILGELELNPGKPVDLLKLGDALLDMSIAISKGLEGEELRAKNIEWIRQTWKQKIAMSKDPSQSEIAEVEYFHRDVIAISELKGKPDDGYTFYVPELGGVTRIRFFNKQGKIIISFDKYSCSDEIQQSNFDQLIAQSQIYQSRNNPTQNANKNSS